MVAGDVPSGMAFKTVIFLDSKHDGTNGLTDDKRYLHHGCGNPSADPKAGFSQCR
jgi:hypothetical protein